MLKVQGLHTLICTCIQTRDKSDVLLSSFTIHVNIHISYKTKFFLKRNRKALIFCFLFELSSL